MQKLEGAARETIDLYLALPVGAKPSCPYFNNRRKKNRGGLRVLKGKGTPQEIAEECEIMAKLSRVSIKELSTDKLKEFIVASNLGVDCSGFVYHVLNSLCQEKYGKSIRNYMQSVRKGFLGTFLAKLRPAENLGVSSFHDERNSKKISVLEAVPGDIITFIGTGKDKTYNHILIITGIDATGDDTRISYAHSYMWPSDGLCNHGVREGDILVHGDDLLGATWKEKGVTGSDNYTHESAKGAKEVSLRRMHFLLK
jgi:hypothetical protein